MNPLDHHLQRLLRAAAAAPPPAADELEAVPTAGELLRARERELAHTEIVTRRVFRLGLATACALLVVTLGISFWHIGRTNADVFAVSELALTRVSTP